MISINIIISEGDIMTKRVTPEEYKRRFDKVSKGHFELLTDYTRQKDKVKVRHIDCGNVFLTDPTAFLRYGSCPAHRYEKISKKTRMTLEEYKQRVYDMYGDEYTVLGTEYVNTNTPIKMRHNTNGYIWSPTPGSILSGRQDPTTAGTRRGDSRRTPIDKIKKKIKDATGDEYTIVEGSYKGINNKATFIHHLPDGSENRFQMTPSKFIVRGQRDPAFKLIRQGEAQRKTQEEFYNQVIELTNGDYELVGEYTGDANKTKFLNKKDSRIFYMTPSNFIKGQRDPYYKKSSAEKIIYDFLTKHDIEFIDEYRLPVKEGIVRTKQQRVDFYLPRYNMFIEFDGAQHFENKYIGMSKETLDDRIARDRHKDTYAYEHNIKMVRIPYVYQDSLEQVLSNILDL